jgi:tripartite-type tricarboxylate transporter receptor subunit TctC
VPDVPTLREAGVDLSSSTSTGLFGPAGMAPDLVKRLYSAVLPMLSNPAMQEKLEQQAMTLWPVTGTQLAASIAEERRHFGELAKASHFVRQDA